ncbi:sensor histidine kinase [Tenacibaculum ovolyticum]|uniref:sensor histidine kinase n=1 Tax=Tenacibaculum ovolyticum TaxID=104270 RepID=UPI0003FA34F4|nr:histidine kinase [Tenacibaculum ovolyticum]
MNTLLNNNNWQSQKVNQAIIIMIAILDSILFNLHKALSVFNNFSSETNNTLNIPLLDIIFRLIFLFSVSWFILQLNTNWYKHLKNKNFYIEIGIYIIVHVVLFFIVIKFFLLISPFITKQEASKSEIELLYFGYTIIFLTLIFIAKLLRYQVIHKNDLIEKEALKIHSLQNELMALKNQVNPHFLFNSLNSLSALVRDNEEATTFISKLSYLYRYILQSGEKDVVTLEEELDFLKNYVHLIKARYKDRVSVNVNIQEHLLNYKIPVLSLQLLVENAVKHNETSKENPLIVKVFNQENTLIVQNEIKPRITFGPTTGKGLKNIQKRFSLLMKDTITIDKANNNFKVKLPL